MPGVKLPGSVAVGVRRVRPAHGIFFTIAAISRTVPDDVQPSAPLGMNPERPPHEQVLIPLALTPPFLVVGVSEPPALAAGVVAVVVGLLAGAVLFEGLRLLNRASIDECVVQAIGVGLIVGSIATAYWAAPQPDHSLVVLGILGGVWGITLEGVRVQLGYDPDGAAGA